MHCTVGFESIAKKNAYHMSVYGCENPFSTAPVYECYQYNMCERGKHSQLLFTWGHGTDAYMLPVDVGFKIGKDTLIKYLVLQVEFGSRLRNDGFSGIVVKFTQQE